MSNSIYRAERFEIKKFDSNNNEKKVALKIDANTQRLTTDVGIGQDLVVACGASNSVDNLCPIFDNIEVNAQIRQGLGVLDANSILNTKSENIILLNNNGGFNVTLPPPTTGGVSYRIIVTDAPTGGNYVISSNAANIHINITGSADGVDYPTTAGVAIQNINFIANQALVGDFVYLVADTTEWQGYGIVSDEPNITLT